MQPQPKQEWSEEDEKKRTLLIRILEVNHPNGYFKANPANTLNMEAMSTEELVSWLKSLRPQNTWRPTKEQIEALEKHLTFLQRINAFGENVGRLKDLYNDLKNLTEG